MLRKASWGQELMDSMVSGDPYGDQGRWSVQWEEGVADGGGGGTAQRHPRGGGVA